MATVNKVWTANGWEYVSGTVADRTLLYRRPNTLAVFPGTDPLVFPSAITILGISAAVKDAPTGADLILDVNKNGTTIFTTQANRPRIVAGAVTTAAEVTSMDVPGFAAGDELTVDVDQIGSTVAGTALTVFIRYQ